MSSMRLDFGEMTASGMAAAQGFRRGLRLATPLDWARDRPLDRILRGPLDWARGRPDKYRILDLKRRRAQIRARRELGLG